MTQETRRRPVQQPPDAVALFAICWFVLLLFLGFTSEILGEMYILGSAVLGLWAATGMLTPKTERHHHRSPNSPSDDKEPLSPQELSDALIAQATHEAQRLAEVRATNPDIADQIEDLYRQRLAMEQEED